MKSGLVGVVVVVAYTLTTPVLGQFPNITTNQYVRVGGDWVISGDASSDGVHTDLGVHKGQTFSDVDNFIVSLKEADSGSYTTPQVGGGANEGAANIQATAATGSLHARVDVGGGADDNISVDAHAFAETADHIMMIVPGILPFGARVTVHVPLKINGFSLAQKSVSNPAGSSFAKAFAGYSAVAFATELDGTFIKVASVDGHAFAPDDFSVGDDTPPSPEFTLDMDVPANNFFQIALRLATTAHFEFNDNSIFGSVSGSGNAAAVFQNTFVWGGISSVTDPVTGLPIEGWSVVSRSGADYSKSFEAVPEPAAWLLIVGTVAGLSLQSGSRRLRKNSNRSSALDFCCN